MMENADLVDGMEALKDSVQRHEQSKFERFLRYTPLVSLVPIGTIIDLFPDLLPVVSSLPRPSTASQLDGTLNAAQSMDEIFQYIQQHDIDIGYDTARRLPRVLSEVPELNPMVATLLQRYKRYKLFKKNHILEEDAGTLSSGAFQSASEGSSKYVKPEPEQPVDAYTPTKPKQSYAVEITSTTQTLSRPSVKRKRSGSAVSPDTPTKIRQPLQKHKCYGAVDLQEHTLWSEQWQRSYACNASSLLDESERLFEAIRDAEDSLVLNTSELPADIENSPLYIHSAQHRCLSMETVHHILGLLRSFDTVESIFRQQPQLILSLQRALSRGICLFGDFSAKFLPCDDVPHNDEIQYSIEQLQLCIMTCSALLRAALLGKDDPQLHSEEFLLAVLDTLQAVLEDHYIKWLQGSNYSMSRLEQYRGPLLIGLELASDSFNNLLSLYFQLDISETMLNKLEFISLKLMSFNSTARLDRLGWTHTFQVIQRQALCVICRIYITQVTRRQFLLEEVLSLLISNLPDDRLAMKYHLHHGRAVSFSSIILLCLVQANAVTLNSMASAQHKGSGSVSASATIAEANESTSRNCEEEPEETVPGPYENLQLISCTVVQHLLASMKSAEKAKTSNYTLLKHSIEVFISDLLVLVPLPEWLSSTILLDQLIRGLLNLLEDEKQNAAAKLFALEQLALLYTQLRVYLNTKSPIADNGQSHNVKFTHDTKLTMQDIEHVCTTLYTICTRLSTFDGSYSEHAYALPFAKILFSETISRVIRASHIESASPNISMILHNMSELQKQQKYQHLDVEADTAADSSFAAVFLPLSSLGRLSESILPRIVRLLDHSQIAIRSKALRCIGTFAGQEPTLFSSKLVRGQITQRISDSSAQVRDIAIDLIGKHIVSDPKFSTIYYPLLRDRLADTGISVRKRVLRLVKEFYMTTHDEALQVQIGRDFLHILDDEEEGIVDLMHKLLDEMWLSNVDSDQTVCYEALSLSASKEVERRVAVISDICSKSPDLTIHLFRRYLNDLLGRTTAWKSDAAAHLRLISECCISRVVHHSEANIRLKSLNMLSIIGTTLPQLYGNNQLEALLPYTSRGQDDFEQNALYYIASLYRAILPVHQHHNEKFLDRLQASLSSQLTKLPHRLLDQVVPCLCIVADLRHEALKVAKIFRSCLDKLRPFVGLLKANQQHVDVRTLTLLIHLTGLFARYLSLQSSIVFDVFDRQSSQEMIADVFETVTTILQSSLLLPSMSSVWRVAIGSMGNICLGQPELFLHVRALHISDGIMNDSDPLLRIALYKVFKEYLVLANEKYELNQKSFKQNGMNKRSTTNKAADKHQADALIGDSSKYGSDGVAPSLMQRHLEQILKAALSPHAGVTHVCVDLIKHIVQQGLVNPRNCVPTIIALETCRLREVRETALALHRLLNEKHESLIETCYAAAVKATYHYNRGLTDTELFAADKSWFALPYKIIKGSRQGRKRFLQMLGKAVSLDQERISILDHGTVRYTQFVVQSIAVLDFATQEEVHFVVHALDRQLALCGLHILHMIDEDNTSPGLDVAARIMTFAIDLRTHLLKLYNISESKCQAFNPARLGSKADLRTAVRQPGIPLVPQWSYSETDTSSESIRKFYKLFNTELYQTDINSPSSSPSEDGDAEAESDSEHNKIPA